MPSIFEKPSILGFRADGGAVGTPQPDLNQLAGVLEKAQRDAKTAEQKQKVAELKRQFDSLAAVVRNDASVPSERFPAAGGTGGPGMFMPPVSNVSPYSLEQRAAALESLKPLADQIASISAPVASDTSGSGRGASGSWGDPVAPVAQPTSIFGPPAPGNQIFGPHAFLANSQPAAPTGTRAANIAAAKASGDFRTKVAQYNLEAQRLGHPTQMNEAGEIVPRELSEPEKMREYFKMTGGNTPFLQTTDPAQNALQNEMMKQARGQAAANTFGATPEERRANLEEETNARQILASPLNGGVRDMGNGVRGAFKDGQTVGFATNQAPLKGPNGESTATMNDPLGKYMTVKGTDGQERVVLNPNPPQINMAQWSAGQSKIQGDKGLMGRSPMEQGLIAAMQAEEAKKKKLVTPAA